MSRHEPTTPIGRRFDALLDNLRLTPRQRDEGNRKWRGVVQVLNQLYYKSTSETDHSILLGSWGKRTAIRPPSDVDVMFVLPNEVRSRYKNDSRSSVQSYVLQLIKKRLEPFYPDTTLRGDGPTIALSLAAMHVEVVPAFAFGPTGERFHILHTANGGYYKLVNPREELRNIENSHRRSESCTRDLIRLAKCWRYHCSVPLKSFCLELLAIDFLDQWDKPSPTIDDYPRMMRDFLAYLVKRGDGRVSVPSADETIWLGDQWVSRAESGCKRAAKALAWKKPEEVDEAVRWWQMVFGTNITLR